MQHRTRSGFTLLELLVVVVVLGILAMIALPHFKTSKGKTYLASMRSDLHNLASAEESYFVDRRSYSEDLDSLSFRGSPGVELAITTSTSGWTAVATHPMAYPTRCVLFTGLTPPVVPAGVPTPSEGRATCY